MQRKRKKKVILTFIILKIELQKSNTYHFKTQKLHNYSSIVRSYSLNVFNMKMEKQFCMKIDGYEKNR